MPDWQASVAGEIARISATVEEGAISVSAEALLSAQGQCEESVLLYRDVFLPGSHVECRCAEEPLWRCSYCGNRNFSVSGERPFAELGIPADATVLDAVADAEIKEKQREGDRTVLAGELRCHVLYRRAEDYEIGEFSIPFRGILEESADDMALSCHVISCRVTPTAEGLRVDAEIGLAVRAYRGCAVSCLAEAAFTAAEPMPRADLELCYPALDDSLWSVGKRYGVSPDDLAAANGLPAEAPGSVESLRDVRYLLIP